MPTLQNYRVTKYQMGRYRQGNVLPRYVVEAAAGNADEATRAAVVAEMVARGEIVPTDDPVNCDIAPPVARGAAAVPSGLSGEVAGELNRLRADADDLRADRDAHKARADAAEARRDAVAAEIVRYVEENGRLREAAAALRADLDAATATLAKLDAEAAQLRADLEAATAPPAKKDKPKPGHAA